MSVKNDLLTLLDQNRGRYISGEQIAERLCVSRTAVWKAIKSLQDYGYRISAVTNRGYSLSQDTDILSVPSISKYLDGSARDLRVSVFKSLPSTNLSAREKALQGEPEGLVILSDQQTVGRGRSDRGFFSPAGTGLYMSLLLRPKLSVGDSLLLTTAAAVAVAEAIEEVSGKKTQIKWVNDVLIDGKKVSGILTDAALSMENGGVDYAIIGMGINVLPPTDGFPPELQGIAASVFSQENGDIRSRLAGSVLNHLMRYYADLSRRTFLPAYRERLFFLGKSVTVLKQDGPVKAIALGVDENFRLRVRYESGREELLSSGEIQIRL